LILLVIATLISTFFVGPVNALEFTDITVEKSHLDIMNELGLVDL